jgi:hypothetical protein
MLMKKVEVEVIDLEKVQEMVMEVLKTCNNESYYGLNEKLFNVKVTQTDSSDYLFILITYKGQAVRDAIGIEKAYLESKEIKDYTEFVVQLTLAISEWVLPDAYNIDTKTP